MRTLKPDVRLEQAAETGRCHVEDTSSGRCFEFGRSECFLLACILEGLNERDIITRWHANFDTTLELDELQEFYSLLGEWELLAAQGVTAADMPSPSASEASMGMAHVPRSDQAAPNSRDASKPDVVPESDSESDSKFDSESDPISDPESGPGADTQQQAKDASVINQPNRWHLFNPEPLLSALCRSLCGSGRLAWLWPLLFTAGVFGVSFNYHLIEHDLAQAMATFGLVGRFIFVAFSVNLISQIVRGLVARHFGLNTPSLGLLLLFGLIPRFNIQVTPSPEMSNSARLWLFGASILSRLALFGIGIIGWLMLRSQGGLLGSIFIELAFLSALGLVFVANPLWRGDGYHLFSIWLKQPGLRERGNLVVSGLFSGTPKAIRRHSRHRLWFGLYAALSYLFVLGFVGFVALMVSQRLEQQYRGAGVALFLALVLYVGWNMLRQQRAATAARRVGERHRLSAPGETRAATALTTRPATRVDAQPRSQSRMPTASSAVTPPKGVWFRRLKLLAITAIIVVISLLPYRYDPGGKVTIQPFVAHEINAETPGVVEEVLARGGEHLQQGTVVARLSSHRQRRDVLTTQAQIAAKHYEMEVLRSIPSPEELALAEEQLATTQLRVRYSRTEAERMSQLFDKGTVSQQLYEDTMRQMELDMQQVAEKEASLSALKTQVKPGQIAALEMDIASLEEQLLFFQEQLRRTEVRMPSDGRITTLNLRNLRNTYLDEGDLFAEVEDSSQVWVEIRVPEAEISHVSLGSPVLLRVQAFPQRVFVGEVTEIGLTASEESYGQVITVVSVIDNDQGELISGMTGFAKIEGTQMPVILAFTQALLRFFHIEIWSWLP